MSRNSTVSSQRTNPKSPFQIEDEENNIDQINQVSEIGPIKQVKQVELLGHSEVSFDEDGNEYEIDYEVENDNVLKDEKRNYMKRINNQNENTTEEEKDEKNNKINERKLFLKSSEENIENLNTKYKSKMKENEKNTISNNLFKEIYEELENTDRKEQEHFKFSNNSSYVDSNNNSKNEDDETFLKKIEYSSSNETENEINSKNTFDMTKSAANIWNNINEENEKKHDLESVYVFSSFLKSGVSSSEYNHERNYSNDSFCANLEMEQLKSKRQNTFSSINTENKNKDYQEYANNSYSKEFNKEATTSLRERISSNSSSSFKERNKDNISDAEDSVERKHGFKLYELKNNLEKKNYIQDEGDEDLRNRKKGIKKGDSFKNDSFKSGSFKSGSFKSGSFKSDSSDNSHNSFSFNVGEEKEERNTIIKNNVIANEKKQEQKEIKEGDKERSLTKLQNWISLKKNSIAHFMAQQSSNPFSVDLKKGKQIEIKQEQQVKVGKEEKEKNEQKKKEGLIQQEEAEKSEEIDGQKYNKKEKKEKIKTVEINDTEIQVSFNDNEEWDEQERKSILKNVKKKNVKRSIIKEVKEKNCVNEKLDITNANNEKKKFEKIKLMKKRNVQLEKENGNMKRKQGEDTQGQSKETEELNTLGRELNIQIVQLEKEQEKVKKLEYELIAKSAEMELEREEIKNKIEEEKKKMMKTIEDEKKKWLKEKKRIEKEVEKQRNIILSRKKLANEIAEYKNKIKEMEETMNKEKKQHKIITDKLKKQVENLTKENEKIKLELKISEDYRNKLEKYQQKTILKLAKNVNEQNKSESFNYSKPENEEQNYIDVNIAERKYQKKEEKGKIIQKEKEISYSNLLSYQSESDKSDLREMNRILHEKGNGRFNETDILYEHISSRNDASHNILHTEKDIKTSFNYTKNDKKKLSLNDFLMQNNATKKEAEEKKGNIKEEKIENYKNQTRSMIKKNEKIKNAEHRNSHSDLSENSSISYVKNEINYERETNDSATNEFISPKQFIFENKNDNKNKIFNNYIDRHSEKITDEGNEKEETWGKSQILNNYPYSKHTLMQNENKKTKNYEIMFENLNEKICIDSLSDQISKKNVREHVNGHIFNDFYNGEYMNRERSQMEKKKFNEHLKTDLRNKEEQIYDTLNCSGNCLNADVSNETHPSDGCIKKDYFNLFGKNWTFLLNFNFEELFEKCENVMKSTFTLSKKIKYRQAFVDGKVETLFEDGLKIIEKNKNKKIIHPDNLIIHLFPNKDYKARLPNSYMLYHFANKGIYQVNIPDVCQLNKFPSGQIDCKYNDGHIQTLFPDGKRKEILPNKEEYAFLPNGTMKKIKLFHQTRHN